jgi:hypothetical protein
MVTTDTAQTITGEKTLSVIQSATDTSSISLNYTAPQYGFFKIKLDSSLSASGNGIQLVDRNGNGIIDFYVRSGLRQISPHQNDVDLGTSSYK